MTDAPPTYTGKLSRGGQNETVVGFLVDTMGSRIEISGFKDPRGGGYLLIGKVTLPAHLAVPLVDEP
jgi:hypothetical protein